MRKAPLFILPWRCTQGCISNCLHCGFAKNPKGLNLLATDDVKKIVDKIYDFGSTFFGISGGEPTERDDLPEIIDYANNIGLKISLITNGYFLDDKLLNNLVRNGVRVSISIDGTKEINDAIRGEGTYEKILSTIKRTSKAGLLDCLVATLTNIDSYRTNANLEDMEYIIELAKEYGARWVVIHSFIPFNTEKEHLSRSPSPKQYERILNEIYDLRLKYKGKPEVNVYCPFFARIVKERGLSNFDDWFNNFFLGKCSIAGKYMSVIENGEIIPCSFNDRIKLGNVQDKTLNQMWNALQESELIIKLKDRNNLKGKCGVCEYREICGGCRTRAEMFTGDLFGSDPACGYIPRMLREK